MNDLLVQWGYVAAGTGEKTITLPMAYYSATSYVVICGGESQNNTYSAKQTTTTFYINTKDYTDKKMWLTIGKGA